MTRARSLSKLSNPATFTVDTDNNIGVNSTSPKEKLNVVGVISATSFFGDGSGLTSLNVGAGGTWNSYDSNTGITTTKKVKIENDLEVTGVVTARSGLRVVGGGLTVTGVSTFFDAVRVVGGGLTVTGVSTFFDAVNVVGGGLTVTGVSTFFGGIDLPDSPVSPNARITIGDGGGGQTEDAQIYHNSTYGTVFQDVTSTGIQIWTGGTGGIKGQNGTNFIVKTDGQGVELYRSGSLRLTTTGAGVTVAGIITATGSVQVGSGQSFGSSGASAAVYYGDGSNLTNLNIPAGFTELDAALFN